VSGRAACADVHQVSIDGPPDRLLRPAQACPGLVRRLTLGSAPLAPQYEVDSPRGATVGAVAAQARGTKGGCADFICPLVHV
jgi:hypothetical protein